MSIKVDPYEKPIMPDGINNNKKTSQIAIEDYESDNAYIAAILGAHGIEKQTRINEAAGEATYIDYAGALENPELLAAILNGGFGETDGYDEKELEIKENVANIYKQMSTNVIQTQDLVNILREMDYEVEWSTVKTQYMVDDKGNGSDFRKEINTAHLSVLTIRDKEGNDIVIADANGNAAIEIEEVFLDEILSGAVNTIANMEFKEVKTGSVSQSSRDWMAEQLTFDTSFVLDNKDTEDIWLRLMEEEKAEKAEIEKQKALVEQAKKDAEANKAEAKKAEAKKAEARALLDEQLKAAALYIVEDFKKDYIEDLKNNEEYAGYSEEDLEELAYDVVAEYCKDKTGYELEELYK